MFFSRVKHGDWHWQVQILTNLRAVPLQKCFFGFYRDKSVFVWCMSERGKPVAGALSAEEWVHASEFVPGQMWTGCGFGKSQIYAWKLNCLHRIKYAHLILLLSNCLVAGVMNFLSQIRIRTTSRVLLVTRPSDHWLVTPTRPGCWTLWNNILTVW